MCGNGSMPIASGYVINASDGPPVATDDTGIFVTSMWTRHNEKLDWTIGDSVGFLRTCHEPEHRKYDETWIRTFKIQRFCKEWIIYIYTILSSEWDFQGLTGQSNWGFERRENELCHGKNCWVELPRPVPRPIFLRAHCTLNKYNSRPLAASSHLCLIQVTESYSEDRWQIVSSYKADYNENLIQNFPQLLRFHLLSRNFSIYPRMYC